VLSNKFRTYNIVLYLSTLALILFQVVKIVHRMLRSYMFNRLVYITYLFFDYFLLHVLVLFIITPLYNYPMFFYFMLMTLPANLVAVYYFDKYNQSIKIDMISELNYKTS
jgi:hypothetical protein